MVEVAKTPTDMGRPLPVTRQEEPALTRLVQMVKEHKDKPFCGDFGKFERELKQRLNEVGRELVHDELAKADIDAPVVAVGGGEYRRVLGAPETYMTTFGPVAVERTLYRDVHDPLERALAILERRVGIIAGFWTPEAAKQSAWVVAQMTPGLAEELFQRLGGMAPSKSSLDRLPKELSRTWEEDRQQFEAQLRNALEVPKHAASAAMSLDGVLVPMKDAQCLTSAERLTKDGDCAGGPAGYKEVGCATVSFYDEAGEMISAIRFARMPQENKVDLKEMLTAEMAVIFDQRPDLTVIKLADACNDNWTYLGKLRIGKEAVDYYHATEHLSDALDCAYGNNPREKRRRFTELADILLTEPDGVDRVLASLRYLRRIHPKNKVLTRETKFFTKNRRRMQYAALRAEGLPVGSGPVEAACKTLAGQRLKQSGMRWGMDGGQAILTLRGWSQSDRFDSAWALLAATYKIEVTLLSNVIDLESHKKRHKSASR